MDKSANYDTDLISWLVDRITFLRKAKSNQQLKFETNYKLPPHIKILKRKSIYSQDFLLLLEKKQSDTQQLDKNPLGTQLLIIDKNNDRKALLTLYYYDLKEILGFDVNKYSFPNRELNDVRQHLDQGTYDTYNTKKYKNTIIVKDKPNKNALALFIGIYLHREGFVEKSSILPLFYILLKNSNINFNLYDSEIEFKILDDIVSNFKLENSSNSLIKYLRMHYRGIKSRHHERSFSQDLDSTYISKKDYTDDNEDKDQDFSEYVYDQYLNEDGDDSTINDFSSIIEYRKSRRGIPKSTIYTLIRRRQINIPRRFGRYDFDSEEAKKEIDNYKSHNNDMFKLKKEAENSSKKNGVKVDSVKRKIRRLKKKGKSVDEIIDYLRDN